MSIQRLETVLPDGDIFGSDLISRLANEIYSEGRAKPSNEAGFPAGALNPEHAKGQLAPANDGRDIALDRGFPSSQGSAPPPVHPTVVAAETTPQKSPQTPTSGGHEGAAEDDTHEFGEPYYFAQTIGSHRQPKHSHADPSSVLPGAEDVASLAGTNPVSSAPGFYFLQDLPVAGSGNPFGRFETPASPSPSGLNLDGIRRDFPALNQRVNGHPLIWLDNAATTHKPQAVLDATSKFYGRDNSNIHRAAHALAERSTHAFEAGRDKVRQFLGAADTKEIIFVRGTTEGINLVAQSYGRQHIGQGDEIILSQMEHHANIVPWQILASQVGATIRVIPMNEVGELQMEEFAKLLNPRTKFVSITHVSNSLGTLNPVEQVIAMAHAAGVPVLVDGAQSTPHLPINVQALDADFFVFSGHKVFGPTGIGAVYGKAKHLEEMPPWQGGGHMIRDVTFEKTIYQSAPEKFEAGTPDIAGVVGLGAAIDYMFSLGIPAIAAYEHSLLEYATEAISTVPGIRPIGTAAHKASVFGFVIPGISNDKIAKHLDQRGIAVRAGHHCAMPALRHFGVEATVRPSLAFYNNTDDVNALVQALHDLPRH